MLPADFRARLQARQAALAWFAAWQRYEPPAPLTPGEALACIGWLHQLSGAPPPPLQDYSGISRLHAALSLLRP